MKKKTGDYLIPFDKFGNQLDYEDHYPHGLELVPNFEFEDTLTFKTYGRGRSSVTFTFIRKSNGKTVSFFVSDMCDAIPCMTNGAITAKFTFIKKGSNFGCKLVK